MPMFIFLPFPLPFLTPCTHHAEERAYLAQAAAILERGINESKFNFQMKLLAIRIYAQLGVYQRVSELHHSLETRHVQLDTLSFFLVDNCMNLGAFDQTVDEMSNVQTFYDSNLVEAITSQKRARFYNTQ